MYKAIKKTALGFMMAVLITALLAWKDLVKFIATVKMDELVDILDNFGHKIGVGGIEGLIGTSLVSLALLALFIDFLRRPQAYSQNRPQNVNPTDWMEEHEKILGVDFYSRTHSPRYDNVPGNIWYKDPHREDNN